MGYIYEAAEKMYKMIWDIIDERWSYQLHKPLFMWWHIILIPNRNCEKVCEACYITLNKCATYGSISLGGVRIGAPAVTPRGCLQEDLKTIADFLLRVIEMLSSSETKLRHLLLSLQCQDSDI